MTIKDLLSHDSFEADSIPADTLKNLLCVGFENAYQQHFAFQTFLRPQEIIIAILDAEGYVDEAKALENADGNLEYTIECVSNIKGSCFFHARYKQDEQHISFFVAAKVAFNPTQDNKGVECNVQTDAVLGGVEDLNDAGELEFYPFISLSRIVFSDNITNELVAPANGDEFYATLCYAQQCLASCLAGEAIDLYKNQMWFKPETMANSYNEFVTMLGKSSVQEVTDDYFTKFPETTKAEAHPSSASAYIPGIFNRVLN